jgi:ribosomal protein L7/L12
VSLGRSAEMNPMLKSIPEDKVAALTELIFSGQKIAAIKLYRELTNVGLKEAKDEVETIESTLRRESPEKFKTTQKAGGCLGAAVFLGVSFSSVAYWFFTAC